MTAEAAWHSVLVRPGNGASHCEDLPLATGWVSGARFVGQDLSTRRATPAPPPGDAAASPSTWARDDGVKIAKTTCGGQCDLHAQSSEFPWAVPGLRPDAGKYCLHATMGARPPAKHGGPCPECASKRASAPHTFAHLHQFPQRPVSDVLPRVKLSARARRGSAGGSQRLSGTKRKLGGTGRARAISRRGRKGRRGGDPTAVARGSRARRTTRDHRRAHPARAPVAEVLLERVARLARWSRRGDARRASPT